MDKILTSLIFAKGGQYLLAFLFFIESITYIVFPEKYIIFTPGWLPIPLFWILIIGFFWFLAATSFLINMWTHVTGSFIAIIMLGMGIYNGSTGFGSPSTSVSTLLGMAFYTAFAGGALMVASQGKTFNYSNRGLYIIGRILVGAFFITVGYLHITHIAEDATMIESMPYAKYLVIFTGFCWMATALSFWANRLSRIAALLASLLVIIITVSITIHSFGHTENIEAILAIAKNLGIIGCCFLVGVNGKFTL